MSHTPHNMPPNLPFSLPDGLAIDDLIDWIESDARARASAGSNSGLARVERALADHPNLRATLEAMRVDRAALGALEAPAPPAWMARAILEEHERQALLALSDIATMGQRKAERARDEGEAFTLSAMPTWFKPALAIAAMLALAFGAWQILPIVFQPSTPTPIDEIARQDQQPPTPVVETRPVRPAPMPEVFASAPAPTRLDPSLEDRLALLIDMPLAEALTLAHNGRLMLVVDVPDLDIAQEAASAIARTPLTHSWRLREPSEALVSAMSRPDQLMAIGTSPDSEDLLSASRGPLGTLEFVMAAMPTIYLAEASATPQALLQLFEALERLGGKVRVVTLGEPLPDAGAIPMPTTADTLLWWESAPDAWQPWASIPVRFIESR